MVRDGREGLGVGWFFGRGEGPEVIECGLGFTVVISTTMESIELKIGFCKIPGPS